MFISAFAYDKDSTSGTWSLHARFDYGFIIAHRPQLEPIQEEHVKGFEISLGRFSTGEKDWQSIYHNPGFGITLAGFDLGSPSHLGMGFCVYPFIDFPLGKNQNSGLHFRYGMGLGYVEKIFNAGENHKNSAIGSHINGIIHFDLHFENEISKRTSLDLGAGITHFSNGSFSMPNLGINIATINLAVLHSFGGRLPIVQKQLPSFTNEGQIHAYVGGFYKKIYPPLGRSFFAATVSAMYFKPFSLKSAWGIGADIFYDNSLSYRIERVDEEPASGIDNFRPGIYGAWHLSVGRLGLMFNMGFYLYSAWKNDGYVYHRICTRYYFKNTFICLNLKSHYARADFIELGLGYRFKNHKSEKR